jgi:hypothetical protein
MSRDVVLDLFDLQVLDAYYVCKGRPARGAGPSRVLAQAIVVELGLSLTERNLARVLVSIERLVALGREIRDAQHKGVIAGEIVLVAADAQGRPRQVLRRIRA